MSLGNVCGKDLWEYICECHKNPEKYTEIISAELKRAGIFKKTFSEIIEELQRKGLHNDLTPYLRGWKNLSASVFLAGNTVDKCDLDDVKELDFYLSFGHCGKANRYLSSISTESQGFFRIEVDNRTEIPPVMLQAFCESYEEKFFFSPMKMMTYVEHIVFNNVNIDDIKVRKRKSGEDLISLKIDFQKGVLFLNIIPCFQSQLLTRDCEHLEHLTPPQRNSLFISPLRLIPQPTSADKYRFYASHAVAERKLMQMCHNTDRSALQTLHHNVADQLFERSVGIYHLKTCMWLVMTEENEWKSINQRKKIRLITEKMISCLQDNFLRSIFSTFINLIENTKKEEKDRLLEIFQSDSLESGTVASINHKKLEYKGFVELKDRLTDLKMISPKRTLQNEKCIMELKSYHNVEAVMKNAAVIGNRDIAMIALSQDFNGKMLNNGSLVVAAEHEQTELVKMLAFRGADVNSFVGGYTALHIASQLGYLSTVQLLLELGAYPDVESVALGTPLFQATKNNFYNVVHMLLLKGAQPDIPGPDYQIPLAISCKQGTTMITELLLQYGADKNWQHLRNAFSALHYAAFHGHLDNVYALLNAKVDVNLTTIKDASALHFAAENGHLEIVRCLFQHGAELDCNTSTGATPLSTAAEHNHIKIVELLLEQGLSLGDGEPYLQKPLIVAAAQGHADMCEFLLQKGANVNHQRRRDEKTALHVAVAGNHATVVAILLAWNADPLISDKKGLSSVDMIPTELPEIDGIDNPQKKVVELMSQYAKVRETMEKIKNKKEAHIRTQKKFSGAMNKMRVIRTFNKK